VYRSYHNVFCGELDGAMSSLSLPFPAMAAFSPDGVGNLPFALASPEFLD